MNHQLSGFMLFAKNIIFMLLKNNKLMKYPMIAMYTVVIRHFITLLKGERIPNHPVIITNKLTPIMQNELINTLAIELLLKSKHLLYPHSFKLFIIR